MTIEEYLTGVKRIYYQLSVIVENKQLLATGRNLRLIDIYDSRSKLGAIRFYEPIQRCVLSIPAATEIDKLGIDHAIINYGNAHLVIWPIKETNDV